MAVVLGVLRVFIGIFLVGGAVWSGLAEQPLASVVLLAALFTICFGLGRWRAWGAAARDGKLVAAFAGQIGTFVAQLLLVGLFHLAGRGAAALWGPVPPPAEPMTAFWAFAAMGIGAGVLIAVLEANGPGDPYQIAAAQVTQAVAEGQAFRPAPDGWLPVDEASFFQAFHYTHRETGEDPETGYIVTKSLHHDRIFPSEAVVAEHEARLGIRLPARLRRLYLMQNGGSGMSLYARTDADLTNAEDGRIKVFSGYDDLSPLEYLDTLAESIEAYADPEGEPERFPVGAGKMIVLARWYEETLFLDYRERAEPRVGFADFDQGGDDLRTGDWENHAIWWEDFDAFFAALERPANEVRDDRAEDLEKGRADA